MQDLEECLEMAEEGRKLWISYDEKYKFSNKRMAFLMPSEGKNYHQEILDNMEEYIQVKALTNVIFLVEETETMNLVHKWKKQKEQVCDVTMEQIARADIEKLYKLNAMYIFSRYLIIDAFEKVQDMDAYNLAGIHGITKRDIVRVAMLGLPE